MMSDNYVIPTDRCPTCGHAVSSIFDHVDMETTNPSTGKCENFTPVAGMIRRLIETRECQGFRFGIDEVLAWLSDNRILFKGSKAFAKTHVGKAWRQLEGRVLGQFLVSGKRTAKGKLFVLEVAR